MSDQIHIAPRPRGRWIRTYFVGLECVSILSVLATKELWGYALFEEHFFRMGRLAVASTGLLLLSSVVCLFSVHRRYALWGFIVVAFFFVSGFIFRSGGYRF